MATLQDVADAIRGKSWQDLTAGQRTFAKNLLAADRGFTDQQRVWLAGWWMACTQADVDAMNALLPANTRVSPLTDISGTLYLNADLLTDSQDPGSTYFAARNVLKRLIWAEVTPTAAP